MVAMNMTEITAAEIEALNTASARVVDIDIDADEECIRLNGSVRIWLDEVADWRSAVEAGWAKVAAKQTKVAQRTAAERERREALDAVIATGSVAGMTDEDHAKAAQGFRSQTGTADDAERERDFDNDDAQVAGR